MAWSGSLAPQPLTHAPCFVNNDYVTAEVWDHLYHCAWMSRGTHLLMGYCVQYACMSFTMKALAAAASGLHWSNTMVTLYKVMLWLAILCLCCGCCYGCCVSQERINLSAFPMLLESPSSLLTHTLPTLCLAYSEESVNSETIGIMNRMKSNIATHSSILA